MYSQVVSGLNLITPVGAPLEVVVDSAETAEEGGFTEPRILPTGCIIKWDGTNCEQTNQRTLPGLSDHEIVFTEVNLKPRTSIQKPRIMPLYSKANWENMKLDLNKLHQDITLMNEQKAGVNKLWTHFQTKLEESIGKNVPKKTARKKDGSPWITSDIKRLIRKRDRWFKRMKNLEIEEIETNLKNLSVVHREKLGKLTGITSTV
ncbi:unnamed protein product [Mytilus edulis]|uniref:Endonuclease-reverse transcriptase n=1 Tax=Mytilus edulis TaxID=6550 RepID=A0A8S3VLQ9_MYTED|nr:unnamed protein product [Mytilus edulis]